MTDLQAFLEELPEGTLIDVTTNGERFILERVSGGWVDHDDGITLHSGDVADGEPTAVLVVEDDRGSDAEALLLMRELDAEEAAGLEVLSREGRLRRAREARN